MICFNPAYQNYFLIPTYSPQSVHTLYGQPHFWTPPYTPPPYPAIAPHFSPTQTKAVSEIGRLHIQPVLPKNISYDPKDEGNPDVLYATNLLGLVAALDNYFSDLSIVSKLVSPFMLALSCITSLGATIYEIISCVGQASFLNTLSSKSIEELYEDFFALSAEEIDQIQKRVQEQKIICTNPEDLKKILKNETDKVFQFKLKSLACHIDSKTIGPLYRNMKAYIQSVNPSEKAKIKQLVLKQIEIARVQAKKKLIIHILGLMAPLCALMLTVFSIFSIACPVFIPLILLIGIIVFGIVRYLLSKGWLPTPDWSCSIAKAILPIAVYKKMMNCFDAIIKK